MSRLKNTTPLGADFLLLTGLQGCEEISQLFDFHVELLTDLKNEVRFDKIIGQSVTVEMRLFSAEMAFDSRSNRTPNWAWDTLIATGLSRRVSVARNTRPFRRSR